ncbi:TIGR01548 family HAD-type hydrolase [Leptothermofonsia sp. ETS-13]|uniref:TIGR01548 family HAD-type hydrolase n=1 Tax=Leptothermofonsia sp. ETS-13 TaxID=3035696 RepID=UPI003BA052D3
MFVVFDIDGVIRDVSGSYRRALADTVEHFTAGAYRPSQADIDALKSEGIWNNDWEASQELVYRYFEGKLVSNGKAIAPSTVLGREEVNLNYEELVAFFQSRYRGPDPTHWTGYICQEPLLIQATYLESLTKAGIRWGFFSGATTGSARYILEKRIGLQSPVLVAMEDAPGKPDPTGLFKAVALLNGVDSLVPVIYVGDTVADMYVVENARQIQGDRRWIGVGVLPPHVQAKEEQRETYAANLHKAGAVIVLKSVEELTPAVIYHLGQEK